MAFNHYAKIKRILEQQPNGWVIRRINSPTTAKSFSGNVLHYTHYYRIYDQYGDQIKYCKFQQIDLLAKILDMPVEALPVYD